MTLQESRRAGGGPQPPTRTPVVSASWNSRLYGMVFTCPAWMVSIAFGPLLNPNV